MSVSVSTDAVIYYVGDGTDSVFSVTFPTYQNSDIEVYVELVASGVLTPLVLTTDYTLADVGIPNTNAELTLVDAGQAWLDADGDLLTGYRLVIKFTDNPYQPTNLENLGRFAVNSFNKALDRTVMLIKSLFAIANRSIQISDKDFSASVDPLLPTLSGKASKLLAVNSTADGFEFVANSGATGPAGPAGGGLVTQALQSIASAGQIVLGATMQQLVRVQGNGAARVAGNAPFSTTPADGMLITLVGRNGTNTLTIPFADVAGGCLLNGDCVLGLNDTLTLVYDATADRYFEISRSV
jgi:hypothetical protein